MAKSPRLFLWERGELTGLHQGSASTRLAGSLGLATPYHSSWFSLKTTQGVSYFETPISVVHSKGQPRGDGQSEPLCSTQFANGGSGNAAPFLGREGGPSLAGGTPPPDEKLDYSRFKEETSCACDVFRSNSGVLVGLWHAEGRNDTMAPPKKRLLYQLRRGATPTFPSP